MTAGSDSPAAGRTRKRPSDRREQILIAARRTFAISGFHAAHLSTIADEAGVSAPALYRHFAGKYELFAAALIGLAEELTDAAQSVPHDDDPLAELVAVVHALALIALENRDAGNIYRREPRLLKGEDRRELSALSSQTRARISDPVRRLRTDASPDDIEVLVVATLSVVASPVTHRVALSKKAALEVLTDAAMAVVQVQIPAPTPTADATGLMPLSKREAILTESIKLFAGHGFHEVTLEQIGAATGLPASGVYRHFDSKNAILVAAMWRASERTTAAIADGLSHASTPSEALVALAGKYSALCVHDPEIMTVYLRDMSALDAAELRALRLQQRRNVDEWASWLQRARPGVTAGAARFLVHAALNVATDLTIGRPSMDVSTAGTVVAAVLLPRS